MQPGDQHRLSVPGLNPYEESRILAYTAAEIATLQAKLDQQLGPEYLSSRPGAGGKKLLYIQADKCINLANQVFGFNGWCSSIKSVEVDFLDQGKDGKWSVGISVTVRITLKDGTYHEDIGYGSMDNGRTKAQVFEKAKKEGTTDALKRALRTFGNVLGNCLYDQDYLAKISRVRAPPATFDETRLHRHNSRDQPPTANPVRPTPAPPTLAPTAKPTPATVPTTTNSTPENEYGVDEFDELGILGSDDVFDDLMPDEVALDITPRASIATPSKTNPSYERPPNLGNGQGMGQGPPHQMAPPNKPQLSNFTNMNAQNSSVSKVGNLAVQQHGPQAQPQRPNPQLANRNIHNGSQSPVPNRSPNHPPAQMQQRTINGNSNNTNPPQQQQGQQLSGPKVGQPPRQPETPTTTPLNLPVGFFTGRAAMSLDGDSHLSETSPAFDPHRQTTIPRSAGIDHSKSSPIARKIVQPSGRPNFENPSMTMNRQIGAPPGRSPYRPPSMAQNMAAGIKRGSEQVGNANGGHNSRVSLGAASGQQLNAQPTGGTNNQAKRPKM